MKELPLITILTVTPLIGAAMLMGMNAANKRLARMVALGFSLVGLVIAGVMWANFDSSRADLQFAQRHEWIPSIGAFYSVGVDGLGVLMVLLTAIVTPLAIMVSWKIEDKVPIYYSLMLFLQAGLFGTFTALNFFHWFIFWELSLIPAFFLIKLWGGPGRSAAATQFFIYTMVGSVAMLLSFLAIFWAVKSFDFIDLAKMARNGELSSRLNDVYGTWWSGLTTHGHVSMLIFAGIFLGFAVKVPLMPFHTWLPSAYAEAPTGTTMMLTGLMSKSLAC